MNHGPSLFIYWMFKTSAQNTKFYIHTLQPAHAIADIECIYLGLKVNSLVPIHYMLQ